MESYKRNSIILWTGLAAAAAGVAAVAICAKWMGDRNRTTDVTTHLRDIQDVLSDCYRKINEIEEHIPVVSRQQRPFGSQSQASNGAWISEAIPDV